MAEALFGDRVPTRAEVPDELKWKLSDIYANDEAWETARAEVEASLPAIAARAGSLGESSSRLLACLRDVDRLSIEFERVYVYAHMRSHEDTADPAAQAMAMAASSLAAAASAAMSFMTPEIISIGRERIDELIAGEEFDDYRFMFSEIWRKQQHVLSASKEALLARASEVASTSENAFSMHTNADMRFPNITDESGAEVELTEERYMRFISSSDRRVRREAFEALFGTYAKSSNTLGATFAGMLKSSRFFSEARHYESDLAASLDGPNIPESVYANLVDTIEGDAGLAPLHRYMSIRRRALKLDDLHMYDLYCPLVDDPYKNIPWDEAKRLALEALVPLGDRYMKDFRAGLDGGWIDVCMNRGKRSGAYSWGGYGTHPYILLNYNGELNDVMTLVHEMGHSMHSFYSRAAQPYVKADYTTFCAEVASTTNEELMLDSLLRSAETKEKKIYLLGSRLERMRQTVYRQTLFASFEREIHSRHASGGDVTAEAIGALWLELNAKYYGPEMIVDDLIKHEWSRIPHFYSPFYVYQYATGYSAAAALARGIVREGEPAVERYMAYLASGGSDFSIELLKRAGVDMSTPAPIIDAIAVFSETLDEIERLI